MSSTRLLQVFNQYIEPGGEEEWVNQLLRLGDDEFSIDDLRFHSRAWKGTGAPSFLKQAMWLWDNPYARRRFSEAVNQVNPQAVLFHNLIPIGSFGLYDEAHRRGLPILQYIHNFRPFSISGTLWLGNRIDEGALHGKMLPEILAGVWERSLIKTALLSLVLYRFRTGGLMNHITHWIAISEFMRQKFISSGIPENKITTLRHCWNMNPTKSIVSEAKHYLFLGRLVREKGVSTLLDAWHILEQKLGNHCPELVIAGTGPEEAAIYAAASKLQKVRCVGFVKGIEKRQLLESCRGLLAPSIWWEPLGLIVYEAYEACRPVIAARSGGLSETVIDKVTGCLHAPDDALAIVNAVCWMEEQKATARLQMGLAGRDWLKENACPKRWREQFLQILNDTIDGQS